MTFYGSEKSSVPTLVEASCRDGPSRLDRLAQPPALASAGLEHPAAEAETNDHPQLNERIMAA